MLHIGYMNIQQFYLDINGEPLAGPVVLPEIRIAYMNIYQIHVWIEHEFQDCPVILPGIHIVGRNLNLHVLIVGAS